MTKAAVLMIEGYEESETIQIVDLLRRAGIETDTFRFQEDPFVLSMQGMYIKADKVFSDEVKDYDVIVVPGGRTAWTRFIENEDVMNMLRYFNDSNKLICGMCSGTKVLEAAGVLAGKTVTDVLEQCGVAPEKAKRQLMLQAMDACHNKTGKHRAIQKHRPVSAVATGCRYRRPVSVIEWQHWSIRNLLHHVTTLCKVNNGLFQIMCKAFRNRLYQISRQ